MLVHLGNANLRVSIDPALGAGIADFSIAGPSGFFYPLMRRSAPGERNASQLASFFMAPWVNRIAGAAFSFRGRRVDLKPTTAPGTPAELVVAQHGDVRKRPWRITSHSPSRAELTFSSPEHEGVNWPWPFECRAVFGLDDFALTVDLSVTNRGDAAFPAGLGHHPYFPRTLFSADDAIEVSIPAAGQYPLKHACAVGPAADNQLSRDLRGGLLPLPSEAFDTVFEAAAGTSNIARLRWPASRVTLEIEASDAMRRWVLFAPYANASPLPFIAVEPQTQVNGALGHEGAPWTGTVVLEPGDTLRTRVRFTATRV